MADETKETSMSEELYRMYQDMCNHWGITSFSDFEKIDRSGDALDDMTTLHAIAQMMLYNIKDMAPDRIGAARKMIEEYYTMALAILDEYSGVEENKEQRKGILDKIKGLFEIFKSKSKKVEDKRPEITITKDAPFMLFKDANGQWRWFARYSNNYRDDDRPAEIIAKGSHQRFVDMVDKGEADYPELWHWHIPGTAWGKADWVAFDEEHGVAMASGYIYEGHEKEAELLAETDIVLGVSHGMPAKSVVRDPSDNTVIVGHVTKEISDLPLWAAANKLTSFSLLKENEMAIPDQKKEFLKGIGFSDEAIGQIEQGNAALAKFAKENEIESKEAETEDEKAKKPMVEEEDSMEATDEEDGEKKPEKKEAPAPQFVTAAEVAEAFQPLIDQIKSLTERVETLTKEREDEKTKETDNPVVPTASLAAMIAKQFSAIGSEGAAVRKNANLAKSGPDETPAADNTQSVVSTGNPLINHVISGIVGNRS